MKKQECFRKKKDGKNCDKHSGLHEYENFNGDKIISCMYHVPIGWRRTDKNAKNTN